MSKKSADRKNVVIVGGGGYGSGLARDLSAKLDATKYNLVLINARPYYNHLVAAVRYTVSEAGGLADDALIPLDNVFVNGNGTLIVGKAVSIEGSAKGQGGEVVLEDGERVPYDVLVLSTGSRWQGHLAFPDALKDTKSFIASWRHKFATAKHIVFVGGGAVAIETAGEIRDEYPEKPITIIHSEQQLLGKSYPDKFRRSVTNKVRSRNVELILGDRIDSFPSEDTVGVTTKNGKFLPNVDLVVPTFGNRPNTEFIASLGSDVLNERGNVKVTPTLEVSNHPGVFAFGDITDWQEQKQLGKAPGAVAAVSANVRSFLEGQKPAKVYKSPPEIIIIPIGKNYGSAYANILWGITFGNWVVGMTKGKDFFVPMFRKALGASKPAPSSSLATFLLPAVAISVSLSLLYSRW